MKCQFVYAARLALPRLPYQRCWQKLRKQTDNSQEIHIPVHNCTLIGIIQHPHLILQDILDELDEIKIGVRYLKNGQPMKHFPSSIQVRDLDHGDMYMTPAGGQNIVEVEYALFAGL